MIDNAKEEAKAILSEFDVPVKCKIGNKISLPISLHDEQKKAFALICINKMLAIERKYSNFGAYEHLQEVKSEIEKL